jgi:hypothetical protein
MSITSSEPRAKWLKFVYLETTSSGKTKIWNVLTVNGVMLCVVKWFSRWRQYSFFPEPYSVYERQCLRDIARFCEMETAQQRTKRC